MRIVSNIGQSNNGAAFLEGGSLALANQYKRLSGLGRIVNGRDPSGNQITSTEAATNARYNFQMNAGAGDRYGYEGACNDRLVERGVTDLPLFVPHWTGGLSSADWVEDVASSPDVDTSNAVVEKYRLKLRYPLSMTDAQMGAIVLYQGESNAFGTVGETHVEWPTHWGAIFDNLLALVSGMGVSWVHESLRFIVVQLFATNPNPGTIPNWDDVRAAQAAFVAGRSDCVLVEAPDGPFNTGESIHLAYGTTADNGQRGLGKRIADALVDQFGFAA